MGAGLDIFGAEVPPDNLRAAKARQMAGELAAGRIPYAELVECRQGGEADTLVLRVSIEVGPSPTRDIRQTEKLAIMFRFVDDEWPGVLALRPTFPNDLEHLNLNRSGLPIGLCISEEPYSEARRQWTPQRFVRVIRSWLERAANKELHAPGQPVERVVSGAAGAVIVPHDLPEQPTTTDYRVTQVNRQTYRLQAVNVPQFGPAKGTCAWMYLTAPAMKHQMIFLHRPETLAELLDRLAAIGWDCRAEITQQIKEWVQNGRHTSQALIFMNFPLKRNEDSTEVERTEPWAFVTMVSVNEVAKDLGVSFRDGGGHLMLTASQDKTGGKRVKVGVLAVMPMLDKDKAAEFNGLAAPPSKRAVAVGAGALGSPILDNILRAGYVPSHVVDEDLLLPHNLARHELTGDHLGWSKAEGMANHASALVEGAALTPIIADVTQPEDKQADLDAALAQAEIIFDWTASVAAARVLSAHPVPAPRISMFLSPSGRDLVILSEDTARSLTLDQIEAQYYWHLVEDPQLHDHLHVAERIRFARSCRDLSSRIPQTWIAVHSGIASQLTLRAGADGPQLGATIFRIDPVTMAVERKVLPIAPMTKTELGGWTVHMSEQALRKICDARQANLPRETGGSLVGSWDIETKNLYVVGALEAPPDSESTPASFVRGVVGQEERFQHIADVTMGMLTYLGEWHSHPDGVPPLPSWDDLGVRAWLSDHLALEGYPGIMLIMSGNSFSCMISGDSDLVPVGGC